MTRPRWLDPPEDFDERAATYWNDYAPGFHRAGLLTQDRFQDFRTLCILWALRDRCADDIGKNGAVTRSPSGAAKPNPAVNLLLRAEKRAAELFRAFQL